MNKNINTNMNTHSTNNKNLPKTFISLIVSHNYRMQCLLRHFKFINKNSSKVNFKNCAILKLIMYKGEITIDLIYEGEILQNEEYKSHYTIENFNKTNIKDNNDNNNKKNTKYIFYIVRHGMGKHNQKNSYHLSKNTELTNTGVTQAINAGKAFKLYLNENKEKIDYYFSSDLQRTRQTLSHILEGINIKNNKAINSEIIIHILPCSNEVNVDKNGNCNKGVSLFSINGYENYPKCSLDKSNNDFYIKNENSICNNIVMKNFTIYLDWSIYLKFYNNHMRSSKSKECNNSNMLSQSIKYINSEMKKLNGVII